MLSVKREPHGKYYGKTRGKSKEIAWLEKVKKKKCHLN